MQQFDGKNDEDILEMLRHKASKRVEEMISSPAMSKKKLTEFERQKYIEEIVEANNKIIKEIRGCNEEMY